MKLNRSTTIALTLSAIFFLQACGGGFASDLRVILAASTPLIDSLNLGDKRQALITDFSDLAQGAANLSDDLKTCGESKPCKLNAVDRFQIRFWDVERRGHFKVNPKLEKVQGILATLIQSAKVYYGGESTAKAASSSAPANPERDLKDRLASLKAAMSP